MTTKPLPAHGTLSRCKYHGCKCDKCRAASAAYQRTRHRKRGYGTWQPLVDAEPVRQHLAMLRAHGIGYARAADLAGLYGPTVGRILYTVGGRPPVKRVRPETAAALLAVQPDSAASFRIAAVGTQRRLQALATRGWPFRTLGAHFSLNPATVGRLLQQDTLYATTAKAVADGYDRLRNARPENHGVKPWDADKVRRRANAHGWLDPEFWEDYGHIDDPDFDPASVEHDLNRDELAALRREEIAHLARFGATPEEIHKRLPDNISVGHIRAVANEVLTNHKRDRKQAAA